MHPKLLLIGLDGGSYNVLEPFMDSGVCPTLKSLVVDGVHGFLESTIPPITPVAWASFQTGLNPGGHGIIDFIRYERGSGRTSFYTRREMRGKTLWMRLSEAGRRVIVVNLPMSYPPERVNGVMVSGFDTLGEDSEYSFPAEIKAELKEKVGYRVHVDRTIMTDGGVDDCVTHLSDMAERQVQGGIHLMRSREWDCFMFHFQMVDTVQHKFWPLIDRSDSRRAHYTPEQIKLLDDFYAGIDARIGRLIRQARELHGGALVVGVISDHGFGGVHSRFAINEWLRRRGYLKINWGGGFSRAVRRWGSRISGRPKKAAASSGPIRETIDVRRSDAYVIACKSPFAGVYVNAPEGSERRKRLVADLLEIRDDRTGANVVRGVHSRESLFRGSFVKGFPDFFVEIAPGYVSSASVSVKSGKVFRSTNSPGNHERDGMILFSGRGVRRGAVIPKVSIEDVAPTVLYLCDVPVPGVLDGRVLTELFQPEFVNENPVVRGEDADAVPQAMASGSSELGVEEENVIRDRLRTLGYLD